MKIRAALCALTVAAALTACSSNGTDGHLVPSPGSAASASSGGAGAAASEGASAAASNGARAAVSSASSGGASPTAGGAGSAAFCAKLKSAQAKLANISAGAADPSKLSSIFDQQIQTFTSLEDSAPADVAPAIKDLVKVLTAAKTALSDPSHADPSALQALAAKLPQDAQTIGTYVGTKCAGG